MLYKGRVLRLLLFLPLAVISAAVLAACTAELQEGCIAGDCGPVAVDPGPSVPDECSGTPDTGAFPCPVYEALKANCFTCHSDPPLIGAKSLLTFEQTRIPAGGGVGVRTDDIRSRLVMGTMPPGGAITAEAKQTLLDWLDGCGVPAPDGQGCECNDPAACP